MSENQTVGAGKVVSIHYKLTLDGGEEVDSSAGRDPLDYLHGHQNIVVGLEKALDGKAVGEEVAVTVAPGEGYGERSEDAIQEVPRGAFPDDADLRPGVVFQAVDENQTPLMGRIDAVTDDRVRVDFNHPLAGQNLHFEVSVVSVRPATEEEQQHGHAH